MGRYFALGALTALVGAVLSVTPSRAADPQSDSIPTYVGPPNLYGPYAPEVELGARLPPLSTFPERKRFQPVTNYVKGHPWYCLAHHNSLGCGSFQAEWVYIFGNCRQFYGE